MLYNFCKNIDNFCIHDFTWFFLFYKLYFMFYFIFWIGNREKDYI